MVTEHILTQSDTLFSLAEEYLGSSIRWREIIEYNRLDAPYIVEDHSEVESLTHSHGYLRIVRSGFVSSLTIPKGWRFKTKPYFIGGVVKTFLTTEDTTVEAGVDTFYVHVQSAEPGDYGNVTEGLITEPGEEIVKNNISFTSIVNDQPFTSGTNKRILAIGDSIYIPSEDGSFLVEPMDITSMLNFLGGEDLALDTEEEDDRAFTEDGYGDIKTVSGLENIEHAITARLMTEKGDLPLHPEYGTDLSSVVGTARTPYSSRLAEIEIYEALAYEDRITDVFISRLEIEGTSVYVDLSYRPANTSREALLSLKLNY